MKRKLVNCVFAKLNHDSIHSMYVKCHSKYGDEHCLFYAAVYIASTSITSSVRHLLLYNRMKQIRIYDLTPCSVFSARFKSYFFTNKLNASPTPATPAMNTQITLKLSV